MKLAAIAYTAGEGDAVDALLAALASDLRARGIRLAGAVQWNEPRALAARAAMVLEDLATGERLDVSGDNRPGGCRLNAYALEDVAGRVAATIQPDIDLVILNRFGKQEAARAGFRTAIEAAVANELPLLMGLNTAHKPLWEAFTSGDGDYLPADADAVRAWALAAVAQSGERANDATATARPSVL